MNKNTSQIAFLFSSNIWIFNNTLDLLVQQ